MLIAMFQHVCAFARDQRGAALVITVLAMTTLFVVAALAIDTATWFVHAKHLQTQADAAAFAGADAMAAGIENGACTDSTVKSVIAQYDGSQAAQANQLLPANQQVAAAAPAAAYATTYSSTAHNVFDLVNQANFENQSFPGDSGLTGSPCGDAAVDIKMTETNVPSFLALFGPSYINKQARVSAQTVASGNAAPFVLPSINTPTDVAVFVVGESAGTPGFSTDTILAKVGSCVDNGNVPPCLTSSNSNATWTAGSLSVPFGATPASLVVANSTSQITPAALSGVTTGANLVTFCGTTGVTCYDTTDGTGLTYARTYTTSSPNFPTAAPAVEDATVSDAATDPTRQCQSSGGTNLFTGFVASDSACTVNVSVDMNFGTGTNSSCAALANTLKATLTIAASSGGTAPTLTCPGTGGSQSAAGSANGVWTTSSTLSIPANAGPVTFDLKWSRTGGGSAVAKQSWEQGGITSGNNTGQCGNNSNACTADFGVVQRIFMGAYDQASATTSHSGTVAGAALTNASGEVMATAANTTVNNLGVTIDFQALYDTAAGANGLIPSGSYSDIAYGTNQANGLADCGQGVSNGNGPNGFDVQENAIAGLFVCNSYPVIPPPTGCGANNCPNTVPGNKFLQWLDGGMAARVFGCPEANHSTQSNPQNGCASNPLPASTCSAHPSYWSTQNLMSSVVSNTSDPRLVTVMVTDPGSLANGNHPVPVRHYAEFYLTGWTGDPCSGVNISGQTAANGLHYVSDDVAPTDANNDFFLVGHFVHYFQPGAQGSGSSCVVSQIDNCVLTVSK
jgi:Flp pilus assembly protein TadG